MIDTHAHLDDKRLNHKEIIKNMQADGLDKIITVAASPSEFAEVLRIADSDPNVFACLGFHPYVAGEVTQNDYDRLIKLAKHKKVVGIGEFGLDFHTEVPDRETQTRVFKELLVVASKLDLPVCLHVRESNAETIEILKQNKNLLQNGGVIHCYSGGKEEIKEYTNLGFYISLSGSITYKKTNSEIIKEIPLDRLLVETDCPYLAPQPVRGKTNEPKNVKYVIDYVAESLNKSPAEIERITNQNTYELFKKLK